jgi:stage II sporulation protein P
MKIRLSKKDVIILALSGVVVVLAACYVVLLLIGVLSPERTPVVGVTAPQPPTSTPTVYRINPTDDRIASEYIMGQPILTAKQLAAYALSRNNTPKISCTLEELAQMFIDEGKAEGVRGDLAFCQSMLETGVFGYGNRVLPEQNNYAGIGAVDNPEVGYGAWFDTPREGVRAQIQHLKGYASTEPLNNECVDPRYEILVKHNLRGSAKTITQLSGKWAANEDYGQRIMVLFWKACQLAGYDASSELSPVEDTKSSLEITFLTRYPEQIDRYNMGIKILRHKPTTAANGKRILLYSSHSEEGYGEYNVYTRAVNNSVIGAGRTLAIELSGKGYEVWHVITNFTYSTSARQWDGTAKQYVRSYSAITEIKAKHGAFDLFIDFHRDARESKDAEAEAGKTVMGMATFSFCACEGKNLSESRLRFIDYPRALSDAQTIQNLLNSQYSKLSPRLYKRVNSGYNQDVGRHVFIEGGFGMNTPAQVAKGIPILAKGIDVILKK